MPRLDFQTFAHMEEWAVIVAHLMQKERDLVGDIIAAGERGETSKVMSITGRIQEIREFIALPENLFAITRPKKGDQDAVD